MGACGECRHCTDGGKGVREHRSAVATQIHYDQLGSRGKARYSLSEAQLAVEPRDESGSLLR